MDENIIKYLKENKDKYKKEDLIKELVKAGYKKSDIAESVIKVYKTIENDMAGFLKANNGLKFTNFFVKEFCYTKGEKIFDFFAGLLVPAMVVFGVIAIQREFFRYYYDFRKIFIFISYLFYIVAIIYFYKKKRFHLFWGLIISMIFVLNCWGLGF